MTTDKNKRLFHVTAEDFKKIPSNPIAYWCSPATANTFINNSISQCLDIRAGVLSGCDELFIRSWYEVSYEDIPLAYSSNDEIKTNNPSWLPLTGGGGYRKWYGALYSIINSKDNFRAIKEKKGNNYRLRESCFYFRKGLNWPLISSRDFCAKLSPEHVVFGNSVRSAFLLPEENRPIEFFIGLLCSKIVGEMLKFINPTVNFNNEDLAIIPVCNVANQKQLIEHSRRNIDIAQYDWDSYETSWNFQSNPLIQVEKGGQCNGRMDKACQTLREHQCKQCEEMRKLEIENNRIFIDAYGLQEELSPEVPWNEITLTCNPWYRYSAKPGDYSELGYWERDESGIGKGGLGYDGTKIILPSNTIPQPNDFPFTPELEERMKTDTVKEFISYAVGCMMGRYSPEKPGLILANQAVQGEDAEVLYQTKIGGDIISCLGATHTFTQNAGKEYISSLENYYPVFGENDFHQFMDRDGVLPILDEEWFTDDIVTQFKAFLQLTFGREHYDENLQFIESALGKDLRKYFTKDFYKDHIQRYKKRPIYWLFSSPKGAFSALIYMHRYEPDTVSIVLNEYLRELIRKVRVQQERLVADNNRADLANAERTRNLKKIDKYTAMLAELEAYERDVLFPLAQKKIAIDLDDGVKVNYCKFGAALKKIPGLEAQEE